VLECQLAGGLGFEPRLAESESAVLPLDDPPTGSNVELDRRPCKKRAPDLALLAAAMLY
jgi:hypothetical protein